MATAPRAAADMDEFLIKSLREILPLRLSICRLLKKQVSREMIYVFMPKIQAIFACIERIQKQCPAG